MSELTADQICWDLAPAPWPSSNTVLKLVSQVLPETQDKAAVDLIEQLALLVVERDEQVRSIRGVLSAALGLAHDQRLECLRLKLGSLSFADRVRRQVQAQVQGQEQGQLKAINKGTKENKREEKANGKHNNKPKGKDKAKWTCERHSPSG